MGFDSYSVDLIYGAGGETDDDWAATVEGVLGLEPRPPHVSAYALQAEPGTPLWRDPARHPDDDVQARRYEMADRSLRPAGLGWYEISNWARPGHECRHNLNYWRQGEYLGVGCAAHSHLDGRRFWNIRDAGAVHGRDRRPAVPPSPARNGSSLPSACSSGSNWRSAPAKASTRNALADDEALAGLVRRSGGRAVLTRRGRLLANEVACRLRSPAQIH